MNEKNFRNLTLRQECYQMDRHLVCAPNKILRAILKIDEGRTQKNGLYEKKANDNAYGLTSDRWQRWTICVRIEDSVNASIQGIEE